jgi:hypothetical protein
MPRDQREEWETQERVLLGEPDLYYGLRFGVDLDEFVKSLDPIGHYHSLKKVTSPGFLEPKLWRKRKKWRMLRALIVASNFSRTNDFETVTTISNPENDKYHPSDYTMGNSGALRSIYLVDESDDCPIVIDSGASLSLTPYTKDFVTDIRACSIAELKGLNGTAKVVGIGEVEWMVVDLLGVIRKVRTVAYYVPEASIRLFLPQTYFQEKNAGQLLINANKMTLTLHDGSDLQFPYAHGSNLPYMLTTKREKTVGLAFDNVVALGDVRAYYSLMSVANETNQNLTLAQKELLKWHWKLGHANFSWIQSLSRKPKDTVGEDPVLKTKHGGVPFCPAPLCAACQLAKQKRRGAGTEFSKKNPEKEMSLKVDDLQPGDRVSVDQYMSSVPGRLPHTHGKEKKEDKYTGGTLFINHATGYMFLRHQVSLCAGETVKSKLAFEQEAEQFGIKIKNYRADNVPFGSEEFKQSIEDHNQMVDFSGTGSHHQNGVAERSIQTVTSWARAMMLHAILHWPEAAQLDLWPFAMQHAIWIWNHLPRKDSKLAPIELFSKMKLSSYDHLHRLHVWGCPVYVLDLKLQDGKKLLKWNP